MRMSWALVKNKKDEDREEITLCYGSFFADFVFWEKKRLLVQVSMTPPQMV